MRQRIHQLLNGDEGAAIWYGRIMTVLIVASLVLLCFKESNTVLDIIEYVCVTVFILDYIARWTTADLKLGKGAASFVISVHADRRDDEDGAAPNGTEKP